jgi:hypothetical protein
MSKSVDFVDDEDFLRGAFDFGLTLDDGVKELVDNSIDANATEIRIEFISNEAGELTLVVSDNGDGIPNSFDGIEGIPHVMAFGNNEIGMSSTSVTSKIGRFGFGLSQTITCLAKDKGMAHVWSRNTSNDTWRMSMYSFDDLIENNCRLPAEVEGNPPRLPMSETGTVVVIQIRTGVKMRAGAIQTRLLKYIGRTYRKFIQSGLRIQICTSTPSSKPNWKVVNLKDPLALHSDSQEAKEIGTAIEYEVEDLVFDGYDESIGEIVDPNTDSYARIKFRLSRMSRMEVRKRLKLSNASGLKDEHEDKTLRKYGIGYKGQGFSLLREGREIHENGAFKIYTKHAGYDYIHGEIDFPLILDSFFNVQTNKSRHEVRPDIGEAMKKHLQSSLMKAYYDHQQDGKLVKDLQKIGPSIPVAELIGKKVAPLLPQPRISDEEQNRSENLRKQMAVEEKQFFAEKIEAMSHSVRLKLSEAIEQGDNSLADRLSLELEGLPETQREWFRRIEDRWNTYSPNRILTKDLFNREVYKMDDAGDEAHITVNTETEFYRRVYSKVSSKAHLHTLLDLMFSSLGYAEFMDGKTNEGRALYWQRAREEVSLHIDQFVRLMPEALEEVESNES